MKNKIIFASKFYYNRGGLESYMFRLKDILTANNYEVMPFSTDFNLNLKTDYDNFFCKYNDLSEINIKRINNNLSAFINMFYNSDAYAKMDQMCKHINPEIVQGFGVTKHLSASVFKAAKKNGAKTIFRLSDFALMCPGSIALDGDKQACLSFNCFNNWDMACIRKKCIKNSVLASSIGFLETKGNRFFNMYNKYVDHWIAPSLFLREQFIKYYGIPENKISYLPVFFDSSLISPAYDEDAGFVLYAGRLSREKGLGTLLGAFDKTDIPLVIAGSGGEYEDTVKAINSHNIKYVGFKNFEDLKVLLQKCRFLVLPSECLENSPNIVLEAQAAGKAVVASDIGGIPEMVENEVTGLIFEPGNIDALISAVIQLYYDRRKCSEMGRVARRRIEKDYSTEKHYEAIAELYKKV